MVIVEINIIPLGTKTPSVSKYIANALKVIEREKDIKYELTPMGTIIEGELDKILDLAKRIHKATFSDKVKRVVTTIKIDERRNKNSSMIKKVKSVKEKLEAEDG
ncbi:MTH1187 family thiamine-binding protein [bacterium]|nr:MTH1187 family thiamine-binding protein [bacterium]